MAIVMVMRWEGVTLAQYEEARRRVDWEGAPAPGGLLHVAGHDGSALRVVDVWDSPEDFERFSRERLVPVTSQLDVTTEPQVEMYPLHALFAPGVPALAR
jgi:hypothetical protein